MIHNTKATTNTTFTSTVHPSPRHTPMPLGKPSRLTTVLIRMFNILQDIHGVSCFGQFQYISDHPFLRIFCPQRNALGTNKRTTKNTTITIIYLFAVRSRVDLDLTTMAASSSCTASTLPIRRTNRRPRYWARSRRPADFPPLIGPSGRLVAMDLSPVA